MTLGVTEYREDWRTGKKSVYKRFQISGQNDIDCYKKMYDNERSARYCSDVSYRFDDPACDSDYRKWKQHGVTIEMFYGGGTVD